MAFLGYGYGVPVALGAAARLLEDHGLDCTVADARYAKPLDGELIARLVAEHDVLVTVEENVLAGASAPASSEFLADRALAGRARVLRFGLPDRYVTHGKPALLREEVGLTPAAVAERVADAVLERRGALARTAAAASAPAAGRRPAAGRPSGTASAPRRSRSRAWMK